MKKRKSKKKVKIRYGRLFLALVIFGLIIYLVSNYLNFPIRNIFILNNTLLSDQEIIDIAGLSNYPSIITTKNSKVKKRLQSNEFILNATIKKKKLKEIYITIEENYPLFYDSSSNKTILYDGTSTKKNVECAVLINYIPDTIYKDFVEKMKIVDRNILNRVSEIKYDPNSVDEERFLLTMNDGNYIYLTLISFEKINNYVEILKKFENKKGILYLDSGEYFQLYE